jgi:hypothetical protein
MKVRAAFGTERIHHYKDGQVKREGSHASLIHTKVPLIREYNPS